MKKEGPVSDECARTLKDFLCRYHFPYCNYEIAGGYHWTYRPSFSNFSCNGNELDNKQYETALYSNRAFSSYLTAMGMYYFKPAANTGLAGWKIALIVIFTVVGVVLIAGGGFYGYRRFKNRAGYRALE